MMYQFFDMPGFFLSSMQKQMQYFLDHPFEKRVANREINAERKSGDDDHHRGSINFLLAWPRDPSHFNANVRNVIAQPGPRVLANSYLFSHGEFSIVSFQQPLTS